MKWSSPEDRAFLATLPEDAPALQVPELLPYLGWVLGAFAELTWDRPIGFGVGFIPLPSIVAWADVHGVEDVPCFIRYIRAMDAVYVKEQRERQEREAEAKRNGRLQSQDSGRERL